MKRKEYKESLFEIFDMDIDGFGFDDKIDFIDNIFLEYQKENESKRDTSDKGKKWDDEELRIILLDAPTKQNCLKYAKIFNRGYGSIEQIYRWSTTPIKEMDEARKLDSFILQIKKVAKEIGLRG